MFLSLLTALAVFAPSMDPTPGHTTAASFAGPQIRATRLDAGSPPTLAVQLQNPTRTATFEGIYLRATCTGADGPVYLTVLLSAPGAADTGLDRLPAPPDYVVALDAPMTPGSTLTVSVPLDQHPTLRACTKTHLRGAW